MSVRSARRLVVRLLAVADLRRGLHLLAELGDLVVDRHDLVRELRHVRIPGARRLRIEFDDGCRTEDGYDYIQFFLDANKLLRFGESKYCGRGGLTWKQKYASLEIIGNEFWIYWHTDGSNTDWGWRLSVTPLLDARAVPTDWEIASRDEATLSALPSLRKLASKWVCVDEGCEELVEVEGAEGEPHYTAVNPEARVLIRRLEESGNFALDVAGYTILTSEGFEARDNVFEAEVRVDYFADEKGLAIGIAKPCSGAQWPPDGFWWRADGQLAPAHGDSMPCKGRAYGAGAILRIRLKVVPGTGEVFVDLFRDSELVDQVRY